MRRPARRQNAAKHSSTQHRAISCHSISHLVARPSRQELVCWLWRRHSPQNKAARTRARRARAQRRGKAFTSLISSLASRCQTGVTLHGPPPVTPTVVVLYCAPCSGSKMTGGAKCCCCCCCWGLSMAIELSPSTPSSSSSFRMRWLAPSPPLLSKIPLITRLSAS